ncbi:MAG: YfhO family protein [Candidatus Omnitrophica bacterium]|nr:YfhO family protein [Candidatus Omnitrophota bacterium]
MIRILVSVPEDGYLYFGDGYSKHWKAFVDHKSAKIEKTNINFKSVFVPKGNHEAVFIYDPRLFKLSVLLYLLGNLTFLIILLFNIADRRR